MDMKDGPIIGPIFVFMMKKLLLIIFVSFYVTSCANQDQYKINYDQLDEITNKDYIDHMKSLGKEYLSDSSNKVVKLSKSNEEYLYEIYLRIVQNNQMLLTTPQKPTFYFIVHRSPFLFSLPGAQFFFSTGLMDKYLKSEELFIAAFSAEVIRSHRSLYEKNIIFPTSYVGTEKLLELTKIKFETKQKVNEWTYFVLKRAGFDASAYLNWIQIQNRNTLDFSFMQNDLMGISKEEHLYKNFISRQGVSGAGRSFNESNSSKSFYSLLNNLSRI